MLSQTLKAQRSAKDPRPIRYPPTQISEVGPDLRAGRLGQSRRTNYASPLVTRVSSAGSGTLGNGTSPTKGVLFRGYVKIFPS